MESTREVSGTDDSLADAISTGKVPKPRPMEFNDWQKWRRDLGQRPRKAVDGGTTNSRSEAELWRKTMIAQYGSDWQVELAAGSVGEEAEPPAEAASAAAGTESAGGASAAQGEGETVAAIASPAPAPLGAVDAEGFATPGGQSLAGMPPGPDPLPAPVAAPRSAGGVPFMRPPTPDAPTPGTPGGLVRRIATEFDPTMESLEDFQERLTRMSAALEVYGFGLGAGELETLMSKATVVAEMAGHIQSMSVQPSAGQELPEALKEAEEAYLRSQFGRWLVESAGAGSEESSARVTALTALLSQRGIDTTEARNNVLGPKGPITMASGRASPVAGSSEQAQAAQAAPVTPRQRASGAPPAEGSPEPLTVVGSQTPPPKTQKEVLDTPPVNAEVDELRRRVKAMEIEQARAALQSQAAPAQGGGGTPVAGLEAVLECLKESSSMTASALSTMAAAKAQPRSAIQVAPKLTWPTFGDDSHEPRAAELFFEKFEEITGLTNDSKGMRANEMLITLKGCLHGSRKTIYETIHKQRRADGVVAAAPERVYQEIKDRLLAFKETVPERQVRVRQEWNNLHKGPNTSALQFEAEWEKAIAELEAVGLGMTKIQLYLDYLSKIGPMSVDVRKDKRMRPRANGEPGEEHREPQTWQEAHLVLVELEGFKQGTKAFANANRAGGVESHATGRGRGHEAGRQGRGAGRGRSAPAAVGTQDDSEIECWNCHGKGHMSRDCPHAPRGGRGGRGTGGKRGRGRGRAAGGIAPPPLPHPTPATRTPRTPASLVPRRRPLLWRTAPWPSPTPHSRP